MKSTIVFLVAATLTTSAAFAEDSDYQFQCEAKTIAVYSPGPNWNQLGEKLPDHLGFMAKQLKAGAISVAGPMLDSVNGVPTGGLAIYNSADRAQVEQLVKQDPLVSEGVANYEIRSWNACK